MRPSPTAAPGPDPASASDERSHARNARAEALALPRLPVIGWQTFAGTLRSTVPSILDREDICFTTSGRAAIALALRALAIGRGDRVLVPTYHCPTMIAPIVAAGAEPVFFPIDASGAPQPEHAMSSQSPGARAMIAAHYFGLPQPMAGIRAFCDRHRIALIEDCAHALFGIAGDRPVGSWGDYAIASLTKFLPVQEGGCLVPSPRPAPVLAPLSFAAEVRSAANAVELGARHDRLRGLNSLLKGVFALVAASRGTRRIVPRADGDPTVDEDFAGVPVERWLADFAPGSGVDQRASTWSRWIARRAHRERIVALRRRNYTLLARSVAGLAGVRPLTPSLPDNSAPYVFPLWVDEPERIYQKVRRAGIPVFRWDEVWPSCPHFDGDQGWIWATHVFQLGCHQDLAPTDLARMVAALAALLAGASGRACSVPIATGFTAATETPASLDRG